MRQMILVTALFASACAATPDVSTTPDHFQPSFEEAYADVQALQRWQRSFDPGGRVERVHWHGDRNAVSYTVGDERYRLDLDVMDVEPIANDADPPTAGDDDRERRPARGRQRMQETSPDGRWTARCVDWNVLIESDESPEVIQVTEDGHRKLRYGTASWVYGEELDQNDAMWWSPDSSILAFYRFDESQVEDYYLLGDLTTNRTSLLIEGYPKPGEANPTASLLLFDVHTRERTEVRTAVEGRESYIYNVAFTPNGDGLLFSRTNRHQNVLELVVADPATGFARTILTERQDTWQNNRPTMRFLEDGRRFIWESESSGWAQYELWSLDGTKICDLTTGSYPVSEIVRLDEERGWLYYYAFSDDVALNRQVHRVRLDGTGQQRLTQESAYHTAQMSPDARWFITTYETATTPPMSALYDMFGTRIRTLAEGSAAPLEAAGLRVPELFTTTAADGETELYGVLYFPPDFDPNRSYALIWSVYGGPGVNVVRNRFRPVRSETALDCIVGMIDNRGTPNRGKAFEAATYLQLGTVDLEDQVAGVRVIADRPYIDESRIGIVGHSYGGYMAALAMVKYPDVFAAGCARAAVTDWRQYDTIYTERYMRTPQENREGYDNGSCIVFAEQLDGDLLILHGLVDDNVHPTNAWAFIDALDNAGKSYRSRFLPRAGHGFGLRKYQWAFFHEALMARDTAFVP